MCGIAGFYSLDNLFGKDELKQMTDVIAHRGPDAEGQFFANGCGLGHRRLSIIDLSTQANQPMWSASGRYVIVFNGEIYNYNELRQEFRLNCRTTSDTEVVIELYERLGKDAISYFEGMFAMAIFDTQNKSLFVCRDRMGVKPLFFYRNGNNFAFSSELKCLLQLNYINNNKSINFEAVNEFLHLGYIPQPNTIYQNIQKLPSGGYIEFSNNNFNIGKYWSLDDAILPADQIIDNEIQAHEILRDLVEHSIRLRLRSDVPFGTFLSGGIDSSLVTAVAQRNINGKLNTFSIEFSDSKHDESQYARSVANYLGTNHHELQVSERDAIKLIPTLQDSYDEPYADSSAIPTMIVSKLARQHVTMTLSGDGGDELFMGYGAYNWAQRMSNRKLQIARKPIALSMRLLNNRFKRASYLIDYEDISHIRSHIFSQEQYFSTRKQISKLLIAENIKNFELDESPILNRKLSDAEQQALFDMKYYLKDDLLVKVDRASMKYSLESRVPLLDHNIVEFALNLSDKLKMRNGVQKYLLKEVLYDYVPAHLFDRPKWGFSIPLDKWLQTDLSYLIDDYLSSSAIDSCGVLNKAEVQVLIKRFRNQKQTFVYNRLWSLIVLQKFLMSNQ